jgi:hypothetical protein
MTNVNALLMNLFKKKIQIAMFIRSVNTCLLKMKKPFRICLKIEYVLYILLNKRLCIRIKAFLEIWKKVFDEKQWLKRKPHQYDKMVRFNSLSWNFSSNLCTQIASQFGHHDGKQQVFFFVQSSMTRSNRFPEQFA